MIDTPETFLPPTPSEVFSVVMPTMSDVDYFFGEASKLLKNAENARMLMSGQKLQIPVSRLLYKNFCDEILNRFTEQGWEAIWDRDYHNGVIDDDNLPTKYVSVSFTRKSHDTPEDDIVVMWGSEKRVFRTTGIRAKLEFWLVALWLRWQLWRGIKDNNGALDT